MDNDLLIKELIDFVEGKGDMNVSYDSILDGKYDCILNVYIGDKVRMYGKSTVLEFVKSCGIKTSQARYGLWHGIEAFLSYKGFKFEPSKKYKEEWYYKVDIQPSYVYIDDDAILNKYINEAPKGLNKTETKKWIKNRIKQDFKYDKTPPRWVQEAEWPIVNGVPLIFKKQSKMTLEDERIYYTFYHPQTLEETIVIQFY